MKKIQYILIALLATVLIFSIAATCNIGGVTTTTTGVETTTTSTNTATENTTTTAIATTTTAVKVTTTSSGGTATMPTVDINRIYGPVKEGNICVQRFQAKVTGSPKPTIKWNHDDSNGSFGNNVAQVNLKAGEEFELKVTVTNSAGSATETRNVKYECERTDNNSPVIEKIVLNLNDIHENDEVKVVTGDYLKFLAIASDEDNDELTYSVHDNFGNILSIANPINTQCLFDWLAPNNPGSYELTVIVDDGNGGGDKVVIHITVYTEEADIL